MSNVLLVGAFGQGNPGDEALCGAFVTELTPHHEVVVASADPTRTGVDHDVAAIPNDARSTARAVRAADAVVIGGGTLFKELHPSTGRHPHALLRTTTALVATTRARGAKMAMIGVGADDLRGPVARGLARWLVRHVDLLVLRDEESAAALADAGAPAPFWIGADPAWLLPAPRKVIGARPPAITVALSHLADDGHLVGNLAEALRPMCADNDVRLQPWQVHAPGLDAEQAERLLAELDGRARIIAPPTDLAVATEAFAGDRLVVALRYHAIVAAARAGTRALAVSHEPKMAGLSRRLGQLAVPGHASPEVFGAAMARALRGEPPSPTSVWGEAVAARHAFDLLDLLLGDGVLEEPATFRGLPLSSGMSSW